MTRVQQPDTADLVASKEVFVIGGPNGAGKTTAAADLLPLHLHIHEFVNADEIARGLSPFNPEGSAIPAGKIMLERIRALTHSGQSFAFETTCAGWTHIQTLKACREAGYVLNLMFLWLPTVEMALARVARRVKEGGHHIPDNVVIRRYAAGIYNMRLYYLPLVDTGLVYDNSDDGGIRIAERRSSGSLVIYDAVRWRRIEETAP